MSHYTSIKLQCRNLDSIVKALEAIGFKPTVHPEPVHLYGIGNKRRPEVANVVVPIAQIAPSANDLGFVFNQSTQAYDMIISDFDRHYGSCAPGKGLGARFQARFAYEYAIAEIERDGRYKVGEVKRQPDGKFQLTVTKTQAYEGFGASSSASNQSFNYQV